MFRVRNRDVNCRLILRTASNPSFAPVPTACGGTLLLFLPHNDRWMPVQRRSVDVEELRLIGHHVGITAPGAGAVGAPGVLEKLELLKRKQARQVAGIQVRSCAAVGRLPLSPGFATPPITVDCGSNISSVAQSVVSTDRPKLISRRIGICLELHRARGCRRACAHQISGDAAGGGNSVSNHWNTGSRRSVKRPVVGSTEYCAEMVVALAVPPLRS